MCDLKRFQCRRHKYGKCKHYMYFSFQLFGILLRANFELWATASHRLAFSTLDYKNNTFNAVSNQ